MSKIGLPGIAWAAMALLASAGCASPPYERARVEEGVVAAADGVRIGCS